MVFLTFPANVSMIFIMPGCERLRWFASEAGQMLLRRFGPRLPSRWRFALMYLGSPPWDTGITPPELESFIASHPPGRAIDLGCGTGTNLAALGRAGWQVTGVDFAPRAVSEARRKLRLEGVAGDLRVGNVVCPEAVRGRYDLVLDIGCYHALGRAEREAYRKNLLEILAPGGHFLIYAHLRPSSCAGGTGINAEDTDSFQGFLALENRQDSQDRWGRPAVWLCYRRTPGS